MGDTTANLTLLVKPTATLSGDTTILAGGTAKLKLTFSGSGPWSVKLSDSTALSNTSDNPKFLLVQPSQTTTYSLVRGTNACGTGTVSGSATIQIKIDEPAPGGNNPPPCGPGGKEICAPVATTKVLRR